MKFKTPSTRVLPQVPAASAGEEDKTRFYNEVVNALDDYVRRIREDLLKISSGTGVLDHGLLSGLADDDHTQYHTNARGDLRYALVANGVTNGNLHDHSGGDGAQINHTTLSNIGTNAHSAIDSFISSKAAASGLASLDASSKVVQDPANATATPTASKIPIADGSGKLSSGWIPSSEFTDLSIVTKTADYTVLDDDGYGLIKVNPTAGNVVITLPTVADNNGRIIRISVTATGGSVTVDGEGFETIDGLASIVLNRKYDYIEVCSDGTEWTILSGRASYSTGWINTADWTIRELGDMSITYDNKTGTFTVGEEIEEYTTDGTPPTGATGNKWIIRADTGTVLSCKEAQGTGFATNDRWVVGKTSGAKAQVNGTSKNLDGVVTHSLGYYPEELDIQIWIGAAAGVRSYNVIPFVGHIGVNDSGLSILSSTDTSIKIQTGYYGIEVMGDNGSSVTVDNEDWYYSILVMKRW